MGYLISEWFNNHQIHFSGAGVVRSIRPDKENRYIAGGGALTASCTQALPGCSKGILNVKVLFD